MRLIHPASRGADLHPLKNTEFQPFPTNLVAMLFRFKEREFFTVTESEQREAPKAAI